MLSRLSPPAPQPPGDGLDLGLPGAVLDHPAVAERVRIPIAPNGRSLNLANAAAVGIYEGWRQLGFAVAGNRS